MLHEAEEHFKKESKNLEAECPTIYAMAHDQETMQKF